MSAPVAEIPRVSIDEIRRRLTHRDGDTHPLTRERLERALALLELADEYTLRAAAILEAES